MNFILFIVLITIYLLEQYAYWKHISQNKREAAVTITEYGWAYLWDFLLFVVFVVFVYRLFFLRSPLILLELMGAIVFVIGTGLRIWSLRELGPMYSAGVHIQTDHEIIKSGPYRILRHPLHLGSFLQIIGLLFFSLFAWWIFWPVAVLTLGITLYESRHEDKMLHIELGDAWAEHYMKTWDIVDLVFRKRRS